MPLVPNWDSTRWNQSSGSSGQNGGSLMENVSTAAAAGATDTSGMMTEG